MEEAMENLNIEEALEIVAPNCDYGCIMNTKKYNLKAENAYEMPICLLCRTCFENEYSGLCFYCPHMSGYQICGKCLQQTLCNYQSAIVTLQGEWTDGYQELEINGNQVNSKEGKMELILVLHYSKIFVIKREKKKMWKLYELMEYYNDHYSCVNLKDGRKINFYRYKSFNSLKDTEQLKIENLLNSELSKVKKQKENKHTTSLSKKESPEIKINKDKLKENKEMKYEIKKLEKTNSILFDSNKKSKQDISEMKINNDVLNENKKMRYEMKKLEKINLILFESNKKLHEKIGQISESNKQLDAKVDKISKMQRNNVQQIIRLNEENLSLYALNEMLKKENRQKFQTESLSVKNSFDTK